MGLFCIALPYFEGTQRGVPHKCQYPLSGIVLHSVAQFLEKEEERVGEIMKFLVLYMYVYNLKHTCILLWERGQLISSDSI